MKYRNVLNLVNSIMLTDGVHCAWVPRIYGAEHKIHRGFSAEISFMSYFKLWWHFESWTFVVVVFLNCGGILNLGNLFGALIVHFNGLFMVPPASARMRAAQRFRRPDHLARPEQGHT